MTTEQIILMNRRKELETKLENAVSVIEKAEKELYEIRFYKCKHDAETRTEKYPGGTHNVCVICDI